MSNQDMTTNEAKHFIHGFLITGGFETVLGMLIVSVFSVYVQIAMYVIAGAMATIGTHLAIKSVDKRQIND